MASQPWVVSDGLWELVEPLLPRDARTEPELERHVLLRAGLLHHLGGLQQQLGIARVHVDPLSRSWPMG